MNRQPRQAMPVMVKDGMRLLIPDIKRSILSLRRIRRRLKLLAHSYYGRFFIVNLMKKPGKNISSIGLAVAAAAPILFGSAHPAKDMTTQALADTVEACRINVLSRFSKSNTETAIHAITASYRDADRRATAAENSLKVLKEDEQNTADEIQIAYWNEQYHYRKNMITALAEEINRSRTLPAVKVTEDKRDPDQYQITYHFAQPWMLLRAEPGLDRYAAIDGLTVSNIAQKPRGGNASMGHWFDVRVDFLLNPDLEVINIKSDGQLSNEPALKASSFGFSDTFNYLSLGNKEIISYGVLATGVFDESLRQMVRGIFDCDERFQKKLAADDSPGDSRLDLLAESTRPDERVFKNREQAQTFSF